MAYNTTDIITKADLTNPNSCLFEMMEELQQFITAMSSAANELTELQNNLIECVNTKESTAGELDERFFEPMNDILDKIKHLFY